MRAGALLRGEQEASQLTPIHTVTLGWLDLRPANILSWVGRDSPVDVGELKYPHTVDKRRSIVDGANSRCSMCER